MFQKICTNFPKEKVCTKSFFIDFQMFQNLCTKEYFSMVSSNVYSKSMYKDFFKYFFMNIQKDFSMIFLNSHVERIKKKISKICTNFKVNIRLKVFLFISKFHCVESEILGNR